jgi:hypothetical protein
MLTTTLFEYPRKAAFGHVLPKTKIYEHGKVSKAVQRLFIRQVEQVFWQYKLAPETINLPGTTAVQEIQVFVITLREESLKVDVPRCIDQEIASPILFELWYNGKVKSIAAYKRPSEADSAKWVTSEYFSGDWVSEDTPRRPLPIALDLETLYGQLLAPLLPAPGFPGEALQHRMIRMERIRQKQRELVRCQSRLRSEKQFNRKVEINAELREMEKELEILLHP